MNGWVDSSGRALIRITVKPSTRSLPMELEAWVDTGLPIARRCIHSPAALASDQSRLLAEEKSVTLDDQVFCS